MQLPYQRPYCRLLCLLWIFGICYVLRIWSLHKICFKYIIWDLSKCIPIVTISLLNIDWICNLKFITSFRLPVYQQINGTWRRQCKKRYLCCAALCLKLNICSFVWNRNNTINVSKEKQSSSNKDNENKMQNILLCV